jgi:hypothetical protein
LNNNKKALYSLIIFFYTTLLDAGVIAIAIIIFAVATVVFAICYCLCRCYFVVSVLLTYLPAVVGVPVVVGDTKLFRSQWPSFFVLLRAYHVKPAILGY